MKLLKNRRDWRRWMKDNDMNSQEGVTEPALYPCFAYTSVRSFGYEEYQENYLYPKDVIKMFNDMGVALGSKR